MARVTEEERARFHQIIDDVIDYKLNNSKNSAKSHWSCLSELILSKMNLIEAHELELSVYDGDSKNIILEAYDSVAVPLFLIDNIIQNKC